MLRQQRFRFCNYSGFRTFVADVESRVVVGLIGDELDPHGWTLADHSLERYLPTATRVKQHHRAGVQAAPQHQPIGPQGLAPSSVSAL